MKTNELMIGDWVLADMNYGEEDPMYTRVDYQPYKIENGEDINIAIETNCLGDGDIYLPIPITPEILLKNGFELKPDGWLWCKDGNENQDYIFIQFRKGSDEVRWCELNFWKKGQCTLKTLKYVHEFQHVLKLYEIDKEIEL